MKVHNRYTESFHINQGVRQGCILSPLLFNIFLADFAKELDSVETSICAEKDKINAIFWADDILMLADNENKLQDMLGLLENYAHANKLEINTDKTKVMIFNKTGRRMRRRFLLNDTVLENASSYKYLGFLITPSGELSSGLQDLRDRALKALYEVGEQPRY